MALGRKGWIGFELVCVTLTGVASWGASVSLRHGMWAWFGICLACGIIACVLFWLATGLLPGRRDR